MSKLSKVADVKKVHLLEFNKDKKTDPKKVGFNITKNVITSTGESWTGKSFVTEINSLKKNQFHLHNSYSNADKD